MLKKKILQYKYKNVGKNKTGYLRELFKVNINFFYDTIWQERTVSDKFVKTEIVLHFNSKKKVLD